MKHARPITLYVFAGVLGVALCAAGVATVLSGAGRAGAAGQPTGGIDLAATVKSQDQCAPCHKPLADSVKSGLIYNHAKHEAALENANKSAACEACHVSPPHTPQKLKVDAPASSCYAASGCHKTDEACSVCHDKPYKKLPADHNIIHLEAGKPPKVMVYPSEPVSAGQCVNCHADFDAFPKTKLTFTHAKHNDKAKKALPGELRIDWNPFRCEACHKTFSHTPAATQRPDMPTCYACHGTSHVDAGSPSATQRTVATEDCAACHPKSFQLKPADHTARFAATTHPTEAKKRLAECVMCHQTTFCIACHQGRPTSGGSRPKAQPADHKLPSFQGLHGKAYVERKTPCAVCHDPRATTTDAGACMRCHKTPVPHPTDWRSNHGLMKNLDPEDCKLCHVDRRDCQACHHPDAKTAQLTAANCATSCHPQMKTGKPTALTNRPLAEHAVHFQVAKKQSAFTCATCHVDSVLSTMAPMQVSGTSGPIVKTSGHNTRLCFGCHGAPSESDAKKLKAPYPGKSLCLRCHKGLSL